MDTEGFPRVNWTVNEKQHYLENSIPDSMVFRMYMRMRDQESDKKGLDGMLLSITKEGVPFDSAVRYIVAARLPASSVPTVNGDFRLGPPSAKPLRTRLKPIDCHRLIDVCNSLEDEIATNPEYYWDADGRKKLEGILQNLLDVADVLDSRFDPMKPDSA